MTDESHSTERGEASTGRVQGLDVTRGIVVLVVVVHGAWLGAPWWWRHADWEGVHGSDLVFPSFVTLSGCALALALRRRVSLTGLVRRTLVLLLVGLAFNAHHDAVVRGAVTTADLRWTGVLQVFAVVGLAVAALHLLPTRRPWTWAAWAGAAALLHTWALGAFARRCVDATLTPACNPSGVYDLAVFGARHVYGHGARGHDPEGLVAAGGAVVSAVAGAALGHALGRGGRVSAARHVLALGIAFGLVAIALASLVAPTKRLWTAPFALGVAALVAFVLAGIHVLVDRPGASAARSLATWPLVALGRNSLLVYVGSMALMTTLTATRPAGSDRSIAQMLADTVALGRTGDLGFVLLAVAAWSVLAGVLHRLRLYVRA